METSIRKTFSFDSKTIDNLDQLCEVYKLSKSQLIRVCINYFAKNIEELEGVIKGEW